jgi:hypothetical protein
VVGLFENKDEELCKDIKPIQTLSNKLEQFKGFRGGKVTVFMQAYVYLTSQLEQVKDMVEQAKANAQACMTSIDNARTLKKAKNEAPVWLKKGAQVWVVDEDDLDSEADQRAWEATVHGRMYKNGKVVQGCWSQNFGEGVGYYDYDARDIFETEMDAKVNLLV